MLSLYGSSPGRRSIVAYRARDPQPRDPAPRIEPSAAPVKLSRPRRRRRSVSTGSIPGASPARQRHRRRRSSSSATMGSSIPAPPEVHSPETPHPLSLSIPACQKMIDPAFLPKEAPGMFKPPTLEETNAAITAFVRSGDQDPLKLVLDDEVCSGFLQALDDADHRSPLFRLRYTYDSPTSTLITKCAPTPVHDAVERFFTDSILSIRRTNNLTDSENLFAFSASSDIGGFSGEHMNSRKQSDMSIVPLLEPDREEEDDDPEPLNGCFPLVAVEIGFSESYEELLADMELWLKGSLGKVRAVVIISLTETPKYSAKPFSSEPMVESNPDALPARKGPHGPLYRGKDILVGAITGFLEVWRYNAETNTTERESHISVLPADPENSSFSLTMLDLFGWAERVPARFKPEDPVLFDLENYRKQIKVAIRPLGIRRLQKAEVAKRKLPKEKDGEWTESVKRGRR